MAESRFQAPDLGAQLGVSSCFEKCQKRSPSARRQPFSGKSFYLDLPAGKNLQFLTGAIQQLGGVIEGFLSKEVSYIVSSRKEAKAESRGAGHGGCPSPGEVRPETPPATGSLRGGPARPAPKPVDSVPMSRGKELLQKAIRNQGSSSGGGSGSSSLLTNARSWGVRILHVDEMMMHVQQLTLDAFCVKKQGPQKPEGTGPAAESRTRKVARLKAPFLKIEDESRKFRPFHHQFKSFPEISFLGPKDASPFEAPTIPGSSHHTRKPKDPEPSRRSAVRATPRRKKGYCECCREAFEELCGHLQSAGHRGFALEAQPYAEVDRLIARLNHSFADMATQASRPGQLGSEASDCDPRCPERTQAEDTPPPGQPSPPRATSPGIKEELERQPPGTPVQDGTPGSTKASVKLVESDETPGPETPCQELDGSADVFVDPPGTPASRSPACQCLLTSSGFTDLSSGPDLAPVGHKRKAPFPSGNAEKKPGALFFLPRASSPCGSRTASGRPLSLPLPGHEPRSPDSLLPLCHPKICLSLPDPFLWQPTDRPAELWATQPPSPGEGWPPGSEHSECAAPDPAPQQADRLPSRPAVPSQPSAHLPSAAGLQPLGGPGESQSPSLADSVQASEGGSCSPWFWAPQPLPGPCLPVSSPQPSASRELLL
ncbi:PREDICTED: protein DBF4 homolog B [Condylura cristata]|uniref:protein DBF4 homolog B n=1 Tax=Condylura cristata TaxID=143302 RepID=UPI00064326F5|nr:PREDICTED: protein DBF4 homolog B [Condylura cristata]